jgi:hypothetical protein
MGYRLIGGSMNTKSTVLCLVLLSATWIVAQSTGSGKAGRAGTAGQSTTPGQTTSPGNTNPPSGTAAPTPGTASPNPGTAPNTNGSTRQSPNGTPAPGTTSPGSETAGATTPPPEQPVPNNQPPNNQYQKWEPVRATFEVVESRARSSVPGVPLFCPNNFGTPAQGAQ